MSAAGRPERTIGAEGSDGRSSAKPVTPDMSPYAIGRHGVTFERKVAVRYLTRLLLGDGASELGDGRRVVSVAFQQAPDHPVDDLVVRAARPDEPEPSRGACGRGSAYAGVRVERRVDAEARPGIRRCRHQGADKRARHTDGASWSQGCSRTPSSSPSWLTSPRPRWTRPASSTSSARRARDALAGGRRCSGHPRSWATRAPLGIVAPRCRGGRVARANQWSVHVLKHEAAHWPNTEVASDRAIPRTVGPPRT